MKLDSTTVDQLGQSLTESRAWMTFVLSSCCPLHYIDAILNNIDRRFSDNTIQLLVSTSIFNPSLLPSEETVLSN